MNEELIAQENKIYESTKEFGRIQFVREIMKLQQENARLKEQLFQEQNLNDSDRTIVIPELENKVKELKEQISKALYELHSLKKEIKYNNLEMLGINKVIKLLESNKEG
jgi:chromosome segregation ATPase